MTGATLLALTIVSTVLPEPIDPASWISFMDYPTNALDTGKTGTTWFELSVDEAGKPFACRTILSSGTPELDRQSCVSTMVRGRFKPARDEQGRTIPATFRRATMWNIPPRTAARADMPADITLPISRLPGGAKSSVLLRLIEDQDALVESCAIETGSCSSQLDALACKAVLKTKMPLPLIGPDGSPVRSLRVRRVEFQIK